MYTKYSIKTADHPWIACFFCFFFRTLLLIAVTHTAAAGRANSGFRQTARGECACPLSRVLLTLTCSRPYTVRALHTLSMPSKKDVQFTQETCFSRLIPAVYTPQPQAGCDGLFWANTFPGNLGQPRNKAVRFEFSARMMGVYSPFHALRVLFIAPRCSLSRALVVLIVLTSSAQAAKPRFLWVLCLTS